ncbi:hypothetical protein KKI24_05560 [bacterium]|nr:hypothetical protein [bacterium]
MNEIKTVGFIGAGTMGCFNSLLTGIGGYEAILFDVSEETLLLTEITQEIIGGALVDRKMFTAAQIAEGRRHIHLERDPARAVAHADLLSESVPEKLDLKRSVHRQFDALCPPHTIMTTNTSGIPVSEIEDAVQRGDRFAAMHFHLGSPLVDIVGGPRTGGQTMDILTRFVKSIHCYPHINRKENPGYIYNAVSTGMTKVIVPMVVQYQERVEDIDRAWMLNSGEGAGPFGAMDLLGINVYYDGTLNAMRNPGKRKLFEGMLTILQPLVERGELGMKTGKGFYTYPEPAYQKPEFLKPDPQDNDRYQTMINGIILEALMVVSQDIATVEEVDRIWMLARYSEAGPFGWLDAKGIDCFLSEIKTPSYGQIHPMEQISTSEALLNPFLERSELGVKSGKGFYSYPDPLFRNPIFLTV